MRMLCCLDGTNSEQVSKAVRTLLNMERPTLGLLYVTDTGPQEEMERQRTRLLRSTLSPQSRREQMRQAEDNLAQEVLEEGGRFLGAGEKLWRTGRPEREIVSAAVEWQADIIVICSRAITGEPSPRGPRSVGHVARFVLDHAPCPVLLIRPYSTNPLPPH